MLFNPTIFLDNLRKAGSTKFINYAEITVRLIPAISLVIYSEYSKFPEVFKLLGWIMVVTSLILYVVPRAAHHQFSAKSAKVLKPDYLRSISVLAFLFGGFILYSTI